MNQVEIDEYRDYEKALGALKEAVKYMIKVQSAAPLPCHDNDLHHDHACDHDHAWHEFLARA
jgi:hypothetical protein